MKDTGKAENLVYVCKHIQPRRREDIERADARPQQSDAADTGFERFRGGFGGGFDPTGGGGFAGGAVPGGGGASQAELSRRAAAAELRDARRFGRTHHHGRTVDSILGPAADVIAEHATF